MRYRELVDRLGLCSARRDLEGVDELLREIASLHRQRVAKNDAFVLRCEKALGKGGSSLAR